MNWTARQVAGAVRGVLHGPDAPLSGVSTDTRTLAPGQLFVPLRGPNFDGHAFIDGAFQSGAAAAMVAGDAERNLDDARVYVEVPDTLEALGDLAQAWLQSLSAIRIALTGSNGKTTTKELIAAALAPYGDVHKTYGNHNNLIGMPLTALAAKPGHAYIVFELGMNARGEIGVLTRRVVPHVGLITSIAPAHLEGVGSIQGVAEAKAELFRGLGPSAILVVNAFDARVKALAEGLPQRAVVVGPGSDADVSVTRIQRQGVAGFTATLAIRSVHSGGRPGAASPRPSSSARASQRGEPQVHTLTLRTLARHDVINAALAIGVVVALGLEVEPALTALTRHTGVYGRMAWVVTPRGVNVIDDTYNANPGSMRAALEALCEAGAGARRLAVLGDMRELGPSAATLHEEIGGVAGDLGIDALYAVGRYAENVATGYAGDRVVAAENAGEIVGHLMKTVRRGDWVLVKGSRGMRMERVVEALMEQDA